MRDLAYIALGSNLGDRAEHLARARRALAALPASRLIAESTIEETEPLGRLEQPYYLNQMVALETSLSPHELLTELHEIERHDIVRAGSGVRAQAIRRDGSLADDFVIQRAPHQLHVLNAPSPAATSALEIAAYLLAEAGFEGRGGDLSHSATARRTPRA